MDKFETPCNIDDLMSINLNFTYSITNLQKYITFLTNQTELNKSDITNISIESNNHKKQLSDLTFVTERLESKLSSIESTMFAFQSKLADFDLKILSLTKKNDEEFKRFDTRLIQTDENVNKLNRLTEENIKEISKINKSNEQFIKIVEESSEKQKKFENNLREIENKFINLEKFTENTKSYLDDEIVKLKAKIIDSESRLLRLAETITEATVPQNLNSRGSRRISIAPMNLISNSVQPSMEEMDNNKINKDIETLKKENEDIISEVKELGKLTLQIIEKLDKKDNDIDYNSQYLNVNNNQIKEITPRLLRGNNDNGDPNKLISENIGKLMESVRNISLSMSNKVNKEDLEHMDKRINNHISETIAILTDKVKSLDTKMHQDSAPASSRKSVHNQFGDNNIKSHGDIEEVVTKISKDLVSTEINKNINNLLETQTFREIKEYLDKNKEDSVEITIWNLSGFA